MCKLSNICKNRPELFVNRDDTCLHYFYVNRYQRRTCVTLKTSKGSQLMVYT